MQAAETNNLTGLLLLIDFQKAFDSISWNFLNKNLDLFGFCPKFIDWIKLFNSDIEMYVLQSGYLSKNKVRRGCWQGDLFNSLFIPYRNRDSGAPYKIES